MPSRPSRPSGVRKTPVIPSVAEGSSQSVSAWQRISAKILRVASLPQDDNTAAKRDVRTVLGLEKCRQVSQGRQGTHQRPPSSALSAGLRPVALCTGLRAQCAKGAGMRSMTGGLSVSRYCVPKAIPPSRLRRSSSLRRTPVAALTVHRTVIHSRDCAALTLYTRLRPQARAKRNRRRRLLARR